jgi:hypothetical protein
MDMKPEGNKNCTYKSSAATWGFASSFVARLKTYDMQRLASGLDD